MQSRLVGPQEIGEDLQPAESGMARWDSEDLEAVERHSCLEDIEPGAAVLHMALGAGFAAMAVAPAGDIDTVGFDRLQVEQLR